SHDGQSTLLKRQYRYDAAGQLTNIHDSRRGPLEYQYDPVGRLLKATSRLGVETFAFDPAGNLLDQKSQELNRPLEADPRRNKLMDNLLREYAGTHYKYDERGNLIHRLHNGVHAHFTWDLFDRLTGYNDDKLKVDYSYDALGRRLHKHSVAHFWDRPEAGTGWNQLQRAKRQRELGCGFTLFGWDGDTLAWESSPPRDDGDTGRTVHYLYEPGSFVPVAQALRKSPIRLHKQPDWSQREYDFDQDPLWHTEVKPQAFDAIAWYQCDHLGTPMELTDEQGDVAWAGQYKAWGEVKEERSDWAKQHGLSNPIRLQGQYHDHETRLHYNRYRYYDPKAGRFVSLDPISYAGGLNLFAYAPSPVEWTDALGLAARNQLGTYGCMNGKGNVRDELDVHELVRHEALVQMGCANKRRRNKDNPSIALTPKDHDQVHVNENALARKYLNVGLNEFQFSEQTGKPTKRQVDVWQGAIRKAGISAAQAKRLRKQSVQYLKKLNCCCEVS
uniref:RHS repeat-associated core domain-containing protein n=1 Tax=Pseudomonas sp. LAM2023 TaxID=2800477 RepID=UPI001F3F94C4